MGREDTPIAVQERERWPLDLTVAGFAPHLPDGFDEMRHRAAHAAMAVAQEPAMRVERHRAVRREMPFARKATGATARREPDLLQQDRERDREAVVDACVANVGERDE